jgi:hypothetical protein
VVKAKVSVLHMPLLMSMLRKEMADILRLGAEDEEPAVKARLLEFAAAFECGQKEDLTNG